MSDQERNECEACGTEENEVEWLRSRVLQLEQDAAGARENLAELEWSGDMFQDGGYCFHCGNLKAEGHMPDCGLAALVALLAAAS